MMTLRYAEVMPCKKQKEKNFPPVRETRGFFLSLCEKERCHAGYNVYYIISTQIYIFFLFFIFFLCAAQ